MIRVVCALPALLLVACQTTAPTWVKAGTTDADYNQARAECIYDASKATAGGGTYGMKTDLGAAVADKMKQNELQILCMEAKGWRREAQR